MRHLSVVVLALAFALVVPGVAVAKPPVPSASITFSAPLPAHVNERNHLSGSVRIKHLPPVAKFCFDVDFADPGLNETVSFFVVIDGMADHTVVQPPNTFVQDPGFNPLFVSLCTTDPANLAAVRDGKFSFVLGTWQGSFDVAAIHTSSSAPD